MAERILVTGGAGFIGSHIVDALVNKGHEVVVYDNLNEQVHGPGKKIPEYLNRNIEFVHGDVRDYEALKKVMTRVDVVYHEAAAVGVGQSMYQIREYVDVNSLGAANILHFIANEKHSIRKIIVASSMSVYGEGSYMTREKVFVYPKLRTVEQLKTRDWEMRYGPNNEVVTPVATNEDKPLYPTSIYAITKRDHEEMFISTGFAYQIPAIALRYFNVYGPRQALSNPYTGVGAIFSSRLLNNHPPVIFEDGLQGRDFTHVSDIVQANIKALEAGPEADYQVFNVGTGVMTSLIQMARYLSEYLGKEDIHFEFPNQFRAGDIRHCYADIEKARKLLGYIPTIQFRDGVRELVEWVKLQRADDKVALASKELAEKKLLL